jgi:hypothetical protein
LVIEYIKNSAYKIERKLAYETLGEDSNIHAKSHLTWGWIR